MVLVVRSDDVRRHQVVEFASDQQQRRAAIVLEVDARGVLRIQRREGDLEEQSPALRHDIALEIRVLLLLWEGVGKGVLELRKRHGQHFVPAHPGR